MKIELSQETVNALKQIDEQELAFAQQLNAQLELLANRKYMLLSKIRLEKGIEAAVKLKLNEDYSLEEISSEEFNTLIT